MGAEHPTQPAPIIEPFAVDAAGAARLAGVSRAFWWKLDSSGRCPSPVRLGRACRWRVDDIRVWMADGCPPRSAAQADRYRVQAARTLAGLGAKKGTR
jgi:predicted DNA-binding transcriptional regulator AlpA